MPKPVDIAHAPSQATVTITWDDGIVDELPAAYLRAWCPCAGCQGHGVELRRQPVAESVAIVGLYEMGAYAIGARFDDGHDTGIYSWEWLRQLGPKSPPVGFKDGGFRDGTFVP